MSAVDIGEEVMTQAQQCSSSLFEKRYALQSKVHLIGTFLSSSRRFSSVLSAAGAPEDIINPSMFDNYSKVAPCLLLPIPLSPSLLSLLSSPPVPSCSPSQCPFPSRFSPPRPLPLTQPAGCSIPQYAHAVSRVTCRRCHMTHCVSCDSGRP